MRVQHHPERPHGESIRARTVTNTQAAGSDALDPQRRPDRYRAVPILAFIVQQGCYGDADSEQKGATTMQIVNVLATMPVADHDAAVTWYRRFFDRPADDAPMAGLAEWFFPNAGGVQVFADTDHAGAATLTLSVADIDQAVATLAARGIQAGEINTGVKSRFTNLTDPAGNTIVLAQDILSASGGREDILGRCRVGATCILQ